MFFWGDRGERRVVPYSFFAVKLMKWRERRKKKEKGRARVVSQAGVGGGD